MNPQPPPFGPPPVAQASPPFGPPQGWSPGPAGPPPAGWGPPGFRPLPPPKKSRVALFVGGGCLTMFLFAASCGGFLLYQEEGRGIHVPDTEVASVPVTPGAPFTIEFTWDGGGYAFNNVWLVIEEGAKQGGEFKLRSRFACGADLRPDSGDLRALVGRDVHNLENKGGDAFSAWIYLGDEYAHSSPRKLRCAGTLEPVVGTWTRARVVVTQRQRPSDFVAR